VVVFSLPSGVPLPAEFLIALASILHPMPSRVDSRPNGLEIQAISQSPTQRPGG